MAGLIGGGGGSAASGLAGGAASNIAGNTAGNAAGQSFMSSAVGQAREAAINNAFQQTGPNTQWTQYIPQIPETGFTDIVQGQAAQRAVAPLNFTSLLEMAQK